MIKVEKLSYGFPEKDLYEDISFTLEAGQHCALIGSNGCGKSTLADMLINTDDYLYDGRIVKDEGCRTGYASQFSIRDKHRDCSVFDYLSERFLQNQQDIAEACDEMATAEDMEVAFEKYQALLDLNEAMDGDNYESNIHKTLHAAGMSALAEMKLSQTSGGEYKILQIMREMLLAPNLLVLDEPDVFLDFGNLNSLRQLINSYKGTLLVITHNRYLLNHCFNKILHLENCELREYDGSYPEYRCAQLQEKLRLKRQYIEEQEEIERTEVMVDILRTRASKMVNPVIGRSVNAKQSQLDRLLARQIKAPFVDVNEPEIVLPEVELAEDKLSENDMTKIEAGTSEIPLMTVKDYQVKFDETLLEDVNFELMRGEKAAIVGANGTGKTTLIRDILKGDNPAIKISEGVNYACLSQLEIGASDEDAEGYDNVQPGTGHKKKESRSMQFSSGEQNLHQIEQLACSGAQLLILDEPTSHLDIYAQTAFEKALQAYKGTVLMVSHDFYLVANCADYVLLIEDNTIRRMRTRTFRKMVYDKYFDSAYLETDRKKQQLEAEITSAFKNDELDIAEKLCAQLEELSAHGRNVNG